MGALLIIAVLTVAAYALLLRRLQRAHALCVFVYIAAAVSSALVLVMGFLGLWRLQPALVPSFREGQLWIWPTVWHDAAVAAAFVVIGGALFTMLLIVRRTSHLTSRCS